MQIGRKDITEFIQKLGAPLVGFAPAKRWDEFGEVEPDYRPNSIWPQTKSVIVVGVPILLPILESTPSINYVELYNTTNILLDQIAYRLSVFLTQNGYGAIYMPRDGYGEIGILVKKPIAAFSHVFAGKYAGLGTIGYSHVLINPQYGPRVRYVSIFTTLELEPDRVIEQDLCTKCHLCQRLCPSQAFTTRDDRIIAEMNKKACALHHAALRKEHRYPCGICIKVCPVGDDRTLFDSRDVKQYLEEKDAIREDPSNPRFRRLVHLREHGSAGKRLF